MHHDTARSLGQNATLPIKGLKNMTFPTLEIIFDAKYYAEVNIDIDFDEISPIDHYERVGWLEGRCPNANVDVLPYFRNCLNQKKAPVLFELCHSILSDAPGERRNVPRDLTRKRNAAYRIAREILDKESYAEYVSPLLLGRNDISMPLHFVFIGCGLVTYDFFSSHLKRAESNDQSRSLLPWLQEAIQSDLLVFNSFLNDLQTSRNNELERRISNLVSENDLSEDQKFLLGKVALEFDERYYLSENLDVAKAGIDPLLHFCFNGWKEKRDPSPQFSTTFYLQNYGDVRTAEINPYYHYIVQGRAEGRLAKSSTDRARAKLVSLKTAHTRVFKSAYSADTPSLTAEAFRQILIQKLASGNYIGVVVSLSHDCYLNSTGGTQIFISDEQKRFMELGYIYINLSPRITRLFITSEQDSYVVVLDGEKIGLVAPIDLRSVLWGLEDKSDRIIAIHSFMGHAIADIVALVEATRCESVFYWLHDYSSLCVNFNLLRNDLSFCGAPKISSMSCRICIYGAERVSHLTEVNKLFDTIKMTVISPSQPAAEIWAAACNLNSSDVLIVPHLHFFVREHVSHPRSDLHLGSGIEPLRVGFLGSPSHHKGFDIFRDLVELFSSDPRFEFFFASSSVTPRELSNISHIPVRTSPENRWAARDAIKENGIHLIINAPVWPETFNYVTYEALAGGAFIYTLKVSGNVARAVNELGGGVVFDAPCDIREAFESGRVIDDVARFRKLGKLFELDPIGGTTAALLSDDISS